jgi:hypothetical protein
LFNHYYFRAVQQKVAGKDRAAPGAILFLGEDDGWLDGYRPRSLRLKHVQMFASMSGFEEW